MPAQKLEETGAKIEPAPGSEPQMVCGRKVCGDPKRFRPTRFQGRQIFFCTQFCLEAFLADPDRFYTAHSRPRA